MTSAGVATRERMAAVQARVAALRPRASDLVRSNSIVVAAVGVVLGILYWPSWSLVPGLGLDESWRSGLTWAHQLGLDWGTEVIFTFGPLYYLDFPLANQRAGVLLASAVWLAYAVAITLTVDFALRLARPELARPVRLAAVAGAAALLLVMPSQSGLQNLHVLVPLALVLTTMAVLYRVRWLAVAIGVVIGMLLLHKLSDAAVAGAYATFAVAAGLGLAGLVRFAASAAVAFVVGWIAADQPLANIPAYVLNEFEIVRGYATAMNAVDPSFAWNYPLAIVLSVACLWMAHRATSALRRSQRMLFVLAVAMTLWVAGHEAFTRHDGHYWYFFGIVVLFALTLGLLARERAVTRVAVAVGVAAYLAVVTIYMSLLAPIDRDRSIAATSRALGVISSHARAQQLFEQAERGLVEQYGLTPELIAALRAAPTTHDPWDISALMAARADWDPLPVLQQYKVYTPTLNRVDADALLARPRQILRSFPYPGLDDRYPYWEASQLQRVIYCDYEVTLATERWQILNPSQSSRCSAVRAGASVVAAAGEPVSVPREEGAMTLVTIAPAKQIWEAAYEFVLKPRNFYVTYAERQWRMHHSPAGVELMLNGPHEHAAFQGLPLVAHDTLTVSHAARLDFSFVDVTPGAGGSVVPVSVLAGRPSDVDQLALDAADPSIVGGHDLVLVAADGCIELRPTGDDPHFVLRAPAGVTLAVSAPAGGQAQVFFGPTPAFNETGSFSFALKPGAWTRIDLSDRFGFARFDPPPGGATLCRLRTG